MVCLGNEQRSFGFEIASEYCISDSFVDYDGYSISSKGFLPTVVDIMVIYHCTITLPRQALHNQVSFLLRNSEISTQRTFLAKVFQS